MGTIPALNVSHTSHHVVSLVASFAVALTMLRFGIAQKNARARNDGRPGSPE